MNLWIRFLKVVLFSRFRSRIHPLDAAEIQFRVWPVDLDLLRHMNNGRYLTLMDLGRMDLMYRCDLAAKLSKAGYYPVVAEEIIRFRRSLSPFQKFTLRTQTRAWDEKFFYLRQEFLAEGKTIAVAFIKARFLKRTGGGVTPAEIMQLTGFLDLKSPHPELVADWNQFGRYFET